MPPAVPDPPAELPCCAVTPDVVGAAGQTSPAQTPIRNSWANCNGVTDLSQYLAPPALLRINLYVHLRETKEDFFLM